MKLGMFTSGYQYYPLEDAFRDAKRIGYDYVELWGGRPHAFAPDLKRGEIVQVQKLIETYDMPVRIYTPEHNAYPYNYMIGNEWQRQDAVAYLKTALEMGKAMGAEYTLISAGHGDMVSDRAQLHDRLIRTLTELTDYAAEIETKILLESLTHFETNICTRANDVSEVLQEIDSPCLCGMCDVVVPYIEQESVLDYFRKLGDKCRHLHLVDSDGVSETHILPGDGEMPLPEILEEIRTFGYDKTMTIELVTAYLREPYLYAKRAHDRVRRMLEASEKF